jgi:hypothetical protein
MSVYNRRLVELFERYVLETGLMEVSAREVARWMIANGEWDQYPLEMEKQCAKDLARALGEVYHDDPQGRRVRSKHVAVVERDGEQMALWSDMTTATREHMALAFQQRRQRIVGDCPQLRIDVDSYNANYNASGEPIQIILDFTDDVAESML